MKNILKIAFLFSLTAFVSCKNSDDVQIENDETCDCMEVLPTVEGNISRSAKTAWTSGDIIGWNFVEPGKPTYFGSSYLNKKLSYTTTWTMETVPALSGTSGTLYAYYPYKDGVTDFASIAVESGTQTDYMWGSQSGFTNSTPSKTLPMKHALSQIAVKIVKGTYSFAGSVTSVKVNSANIGTTGTLNATTGAVTVSAGTGTELPLNGGNKTITTEGVTYDLIFVQGSAAAAPTFTIVMDGTTYKVTPQSFLPEAGKIHTFTITANSSGMSLSDVSIAAWVAVSAGGGTIQ